jgi:pyrroline-5-carboxylate reductase
MTYPRLSFIGAGNMARSLIGGLIADGYPSEQIRVSDPSPDQLTTLAKHCSVQSGTDNIAAARDADALILAVKPQVLHDVVVQLSEVVAQNKTLVISIAAGIRESDIDRWLGGKAAAIVRAMPNTPALIQCGATALYANAQVTQEQRDLAESVLRAVGLTLWLNDEALMDTITAVSGSGPAYFLLVMEILQSVGTELGLDPGSARLLTLQTAFGAAKMALESPDDPATLRGRVTSPGGTTEQAIRVLEEGGLHALISEAVRAARDRSEELANQLGRS